MHFKVVPCPLSHIKKFIETWHYSKSVNGLHITQCFKLMDGNNLIGGMTFGLLGMANVWKKYANHEKDIVELNRLCCIDNTPKNTESFFIGKALRWLKNNTYIKYIISYADPYYHHSGIIYKATNFKYLGVTASSRKINYNNKLYHDKCIRTKHNGRLKPFAQRVKDALKSGEAFYINTPPKHIYFYKFNRKRYHPKEKRPIQKTLSNFF